MEQAERWDREQRGGDDGVGALAPPLAAATVMPVGLTIDRTGSIWRELLIR
ncbi:hypothetical protein ACF3MZ_00135 [Paenibacillaceae bacterium WGS1546]|uniref:hypothetical protein n=1 Tax=Cohnella sp. WGS1546 TaxID=3366810 RepID=UPI00372D51B2